MDVMADAIVLCDWIHERGKDTENVGRRDGTFA